MAVALLLIVHATPGVAQASVSTDASNPATSDTTQQLSLEELARLKQNPVSELRQLLLDVLIGPDVPNTERTAAGYTLEVVWPFSLDEEWRLISYTILSLIQLPVPDDDTQVGLGNTLINLFIAPKRKPDKLVWGAGPAILLPTRTDSDLGTNRLGLGPALVLYYPQEVWDAGVVLQNVWSLGGEGINEVNAFSAQYFITYNLPKGWFLYSGSTVSADWTANDSDRWTVPVGGGFGKLFTLGKQPMSLSLQLFSNVVKPDASPRTTADGQFSLLFP